MQHPIGARVKSKLKGRNFGVEGIVTAHWPVGRAGRFDIFVVSFGPWERMYKREIQPMLPGEGAWTRSQDWERIIDPPLEMEETEQELERI